MSSAAPLQNTAAKSPPPGTSAHRGLLLQRKCACGSPTQSMSGECAECQGKKLQRSPLAIGAPDDRLEQEADRVADAVVAGEPGLPALSPGLTRKVHRDKPTGKCPLWRSPADLSGVAAEHYLLTEFNMALKHTRVLCDGGPMCTVWFTPGSPMERLNDIEVNVDIGPPFVDVQRVDIRGPSCRYTYDCKDKEPPVFTKVHCIKVPPPSNTATGDKAPHVQRSLSHSPQVIARQAAPKKMFGLTTPAFPGEQPKHKLPSGKKQEEDGSALRRKCTGTIAEATVNDAAPSIVDEVLRSPGQPLDPETRAFMERRFGHDFSQVRVHSDATAEQSAQEVNAEAYTVGNDVVFGAAWFAPWTHEGRRLIAHELAHTIQQRGVVQRSPDFQGVLPKNSVEKIATAAIADEKAKIPVGDTALPAAVERDVKWFLRLSERQSALNILVNHLIAAGTIERRYLYGGEMRYADWMEGLEGESEIKGENPDGSKIVLIQIGVEAFDPPINNDPSARAGPDISWLYSTVLHECTHVVQMQQPKGDLSKIVDLTERQTRRHIYDIEAYAQEINSASKTGVDKKPRQVEDFWMRLHKDNWMKINNPDALKDPKVIAVLTKPEKKRLNELYAIAYKTAKDIVMKPLPHLLFK